MVVIDDNGTPDWVPASDWVATPKALVTAAPNEPGELVTYTLDSESLRAAQKAAEAFYVFFKADQDLRSIAELVESLRRPEIPAVTRSVISHIIEAVLLFEKSACLERLAEITPQSEIDRVIEDLLRNGDDPEGRQ
ncbi:MAG: hypothetical protein JWQ87_2645, partial [Candidatus Sulfotelmatobacter sp.]|nr:hypothetical protein [Candidatus Sulfotelmatobacter sp.]